MKPKGKIVKSLFKTYFDGCYETEPQPNTSNTYDMGVCRLLYNERKNTLLVYTRRPELLIGRKGKIIKALEGYLECNIVVIRAQIF